MLDWLFDLVCILKDLVVWIVNFLFDLIALLIQGVIFLLPNTPFKFESLEWGSFGQMVGYFIPVQTMFGHMAAIVGVMLSWFAISYILRLIKLIR
jgi:hypothetical protein